MTSNRDWWSFSASGKRIFYMVFASGVVFSVGLYVAFRFYLNLEEFALPIAAILFIVDTLTAIFAGRAMTRAEELPGMKQ
ncbi:MAG: hypothetical protein JO056_10000 [Alphaproteobacteria bacterium]|nr:hypothetical protein [Alphaproteobacteria bacterium]